MDARAFAGQVLAALVKLDPRASALEVRARGPAAVIGLEDEGEFVPLLRVAAPSAHYNVMSLFVSHHGRWLPTLKRGTPQQLADELAGPLQHLWAIPVQMAGPWLDLLDS